MRSSILQSVHHDGSPRYVKLSQTGAPQLGDEITLRLRADLQAPIEKVLLRTTPDGEQVFTEMQPAGQERACRWWQVQLRLNEPLLSYRFLLFTADGAWWYNGSGLQRHIPTDAENFRLLADYQASDWVRESVFYQIFPDRFADGDPTNNVRDAEWEYRGRTTRARAWGEPQSSGPGAMVEFYGGDLPGIEAHLGHLEELGANALYINPIFTAYSNHRYDVVDYESVDPHLGGNLALRLLRQATRARNMRLILDIVPNHCGILHPWFQAAQADPTVPQANYFTFHRHPDEYESWLGVRTLPKLNYGSAGLRAVMYQNPDSILRKWLQPPYSIDGWRLDVANMLARQGANQMGVEVGQGIRIAIKAENPSAYILGENFFDASMQLQGDIWDAAMNYSGFSIPLRYWLMNFEIHPHANPGSIVTHQTWPTQALVDTWQAYRAAIPWQIAIQQYNLLGSHDTSRILGFLGGDRAKNHLAVTILFTYVGVPCIYYGDEIGLGAEQEGSSRECMPWDRSVWDLELFEFYKNLVALRRSSAALREGGFQVLLVEDDLLAYLRDSEQELIIVVANRGPELRPAGELPVRHAAIPDGVIFTDIASGVQLRVVNGFLPLPAVPAGAQVWRAWV
jgi:alpha-glucosidase